MDSIQLVGECSIYEVTQLHQKINDNWQRKTDLNLDVSGVTEVDASFVQLLAGCKKEAEENDHQFELVNPSEPLLKKINAMFMDDYFFAEGKLSKEKFSDPEQAQSRESETVGD